MEYLSISLSALKPGDDGTMENRAVLKISCVAVVLAKESRDTSQDPEINRPDSLQATLQCRRILYSEIKLRLLNSHV